MTQVLTLIMFVAVHEDGHYLGYWHGPIGRELSESPVIRLDSEGQFSLVGSSLADTLLTDIYDDEERFDERDAGFKELELTPSIEEIPDHNLPAAMHH
ncbi:MAG: hypothetical protein ACJAZO_004317 [Myxococcota bacterium]|jgi:hypothetical protein